MERDQAKIQYKFKKMMTKKKKEFAAGLDKQAKAKLLMKKPLKDGDMRILSVSSDEDDSDIDIDPNSEI